MCRITGSCIYTRVHACDCMCDQVDVCIYTRVQSWVSMEPHDHAMCTCVPTQTRVCEHAHTHVPAPVCEHTWAHLAKPHVHMCGRESTGMKGPPSLLPAAETPKSSFFPQETGTGRGSRTAPSCPSPTVPPSAGAG